MMRQLLGLILAVSLTTAVMAQGMEQNTDRPGENYRNFDLQDPQPARCQAACQEDRRCRAWTYVRPGVQGPKARCWLKAGVPPTKSDRCCVSGVKSGASMMQVPPQAVSPKPPIGVLSQPPADVMQRLQTDTQSRVTLLTDKVSINCWEVREEQCQKWREAGSPPPMPPMSPACTKVLWFDPCTIETMDCVKIPCPETFQPGTNCWICK